MADQPVEKIMDDQNKVLFIVERPYYEQEQLNSELSYKKPRYNFGKVTIIKIKQINPIRVLLSIIPILEWLPKYSLRKDLTGDIISGCTVAIMHIPQGLAYSLLAGAPPIVGIYMAFFPVLVYVIFGTSRHNSMGTLALISIMVGKSISTIATSHREVQERNVTNIVEEFSGVDKPIYSPTEITATLCFMVGVIQITMYIFRLGILASLLSETLVSAFMASGGIHVMSTQIKDLLGLQLQPSPAVFKLPYTYYEIGKNVLQTNVAALGISILSITILVIFTDYIKPRLLKKCLIPMPIELIMVVGVTIISKFMSLSDIYDISVIGSIPTGFPDIHLPKLELVPVLAVDSFTIAMVSYALSLSMALQFAQKDNYEVSSNQELLAMGAGNLIGSLFSCMPFAASFSRSFIQKSVGGRTQITSVVSCIILSIVLLWIGPFFESLPKCVLASIILVALRSILKQVKDFLIFWRMSRLDAIVWMGTFLCVVIVAIDIGLLVGIVLGLVSIFIRGLKPYTCLLGHVPKTDLYLDTSRYKGAIELECIKIFHYCGSINFASRNTFKSELCEKIGLNLSKEIRRLTKTAKGQNCKRYEPLYLKCLVVDFSALSYIDASGATALKNLISEIKKLSITVCIAGASCPTYEMMKKAELKETSDEKFKIFPTVHDAVHYAQNFVSPISIVPVNDSS